MEGPEDFDNQPIKSPSAVAVGISAGLSFLADYGWFLLIGLVIFVYVWQKYGITIWARWTTTRDRDHIYKKDDDNVTMLNRQEALLAARQRMQEEQDRLSALAKEEAAKREEQKRLQKIEEWERHKKGAGYHSKMHVPEEKASTTGVNLQKSQNKKPLRQTDYNPLSGGGGCNYRPSRRFGNAGGG